MRGVLLLFDPDKQRQLNLAQLLRGKGHTVDVASRLKEFGTRVNNRDYDVMIIAAGVHDVHELLRRAKRDQPFTEIIVSPEQPTVEDAVEAIKEGAFHYLAYPSSIQKMELLVQKALERRMLTIEVQELRNQLRDTGGVRIIGESPAIQELKKTLQRVATMDCTVLIRGETGTGKELTSRAIHEMSPRADKKFLAVNCGALSEDILANELFGHEKGAFTGAESMKKGLFEAASGGTILLDEIGETPPPMQVQLLRVLQERKIMRVGGTEEIPVNVRVLAATNRSLRDEVAQGRFREDLYFRLNVFTLRIPPLRERRDDIPLFCRYFLDKFNSQFKKNVERISEEVMRQIMGYSFPGNVRELENILERAVVLCDGSEVLLSHLPRRLLDAPRTVSLEDDLPSLAEMERRYIKSILEHTKGNKSRAARILGINRSSLWRKLHAEE